MKITVTETRECCQERDLKPYMGDQQGTFWPPNNMAFCQYCGQLHVQEAYTDAAGDVDTRWRKWP